MSKQRRVGKSIEEIMVRRKFDSTDPVTWPDPLQKMTRGKNSTTLPNLEMALTTTSGASSQANITGALHGYSEDDKNKIMNSLMNYCTALQKRVSELESDNGKRTRHALSRSMNMPAIDYDMTAMSAAGLQTAVSTSYGSRSNLQSAATASQSYTSQQNHNQLDSGALPEASNARSFASRTGSRSASSAVGHIIGDIDEKVWNLKELFRKGDPLEQRRKCASKLVAVVRGYLVRCRRDAHKKALLDWKWIRCRQVVHLLDILLANHSNRDDGMTMLRMNRNMKTMTNVFSKWAAIYRTNLPMRKTIKQAAEEKIELKKMQWLRTVFDAFRSATVGTSSTKHANLERHKLVERLRKELSRNLIARGLLGVVPEMELEDALHKEVVIQFQQRKKVLLKQWLFRSLKTVHRVAKRNMQRAKEYRFKNLVGKVFYAWSDYAYLAYVGIERKQWLGPRKYEIRYNQKRVDHFAGFRCTRMIFKAWKAYFWQKFKVKQMHRSQVARYIQRVFKGWAAQAQHQHRLRQLTYDNWKGYSRLIVFNPFYAWSNHVKAVKNHSNEQLRIAKSYLRWKWRQKILKIMKAWRHLALFGRMDGLYTRQMLLKSLGEQKILTNQLERLMIDQTTELDECRTLVRKEIEKRKALEAQLSESAHNNNSLRMVNHHYQQEIMKLEATLNAAVAINPKQLEHLRELHPEFKFKERPLPIPKNANEFIDDKPVDTNTSPPITAGGTDSAPNTANNGSTESGANAESSKSSDGGSGQAHSSGVQISEPGNSGTEVGGQEQPQEGTTNTNTVGLVANGSQKNVEGVEAASGNTKNPLLPPPVDVTAGPVTDASVSTVATPASTLGSPEPQKTPKYRATVDHGMLSSIMETGGRPVVGDASDSSDNTKNGMASLNPDDKLLLTRVKWLVDRYRDTRHLEQRAAHQRTSMTLLHGAGYFSVGNIHVPHGGASEAEEEAYLAMLEEIEHEAAAIAVGDMSSLWLDKRPPILPATTGPINSSSSSSSSSTATAAVDDGGALRAAAATAAAIGGVPFGGAALQTQFSATAPATTTSSSTPFSPVAGDFSRSKSNTAITVDNTTLRPGSQQGGNRLEVTAALDDVHNGQHSRQHPKYGLSDRILLSFIDFLDSGDTTYFSAEDRRLWTVHLMGLSNTRSSLIASSEMAQHMVEVAAAVDALQEEEKAEQIAAEAAVTLAGGKTTEELNADTESVVGDATTPKKKPIEVDLGSESPLRSLTVLETDEGGGTSSWRSALMALRSEYPLYPAASPVKGMSGTVTLGGSVSLDTANEVNMFKRVLAMRENLDQVMERQVSKYQRRLQEKMSMAALVEQEEGGGGGFGGDENEESDDEDFDPPGTKPKHAPNKSLIAENKALQAAKDLKNRRVMPMGSNIYASNLKNMRGDGVGGRMGGESGVEDYDGCGPPLLKSKSTLENDVIDHVLATDDMYADLDED